MVVGGVFQDRLVRLDLLQENVVFLVILTAVVVVLTAVAVVGIVIKERWLRLGNGTDYLHIIRSE